VKVAQKIVEGEMKELNKVVYALVEHGLCHMMIEEMLSSLGIFKSSLQLRRRYRSLVLRDDQILTLRYQSKVLTPAWPHAIQAKQWA
jgi:hypothetical protein